MKDAKGHGSDTHSTGVQAVGKGMQINGFKAAPTKFGLDQVLVNKSMSLGDAPKLNATMKGYGLTPAPKGVLPGWVDSNGAMKASLHAHSSGGVALFVGKH
jgi:hypothetical protein